MQTPSRSAREKKDTSSGCEQLFVRLMNKFGKEMGLTNTNYENVHGMSNSRNYSTCEDLVTLSKEAMGSQWFREITGTQYFFLLFVIHSGRVYNITVKRGEELKI
jgi:D-alanyl-D-alanine carboxypeptidase